MRIHKPYILMIFGWSPRWRGDNNGIFFLDQFHTLSNAYNVHGIAVNLLSVRNSNSLRRGLHFGLRKLAPKLSTANFISFPIFDVYVQREFYLSILIKLSIKRHGWPKVVHLQGCVGFSEKFIRFITNNYRIPYIITEHQSALINTLNYEHEKSIREIYSGASDIIAVSDFLRQAILKRISREITIIPNILAYTNLYGKISAPKIREKFVIVTSCRLSKIKNVDLMIRALQIASVSIPIYLHIIGDGEEKSSLKLLAMRLGIENRVSFLGEKPRTDIFKHYSEVCHAYINASTIETFGISIIEALASGLPVICTHSGGPADYVTSSNGFWSGSDPRQLSDAMIKMYEEYDKFDCHEISTHAINAFSASKFLHRMRVIYDKYA